MASDRVPHETTAQELVDEVGLAGLGYDVTIEPGPGARISFRIGHPLLLDNTWAVSVDASSPNWEEDVRTMLGAHPDLDVVRACPARDETVPIVAALRSGAIQGRMSNRDEGAAAALTAISCTALALASRGVLTPEEADWVLRAINTDQQWFRS